MVVFKMSDRLKDHIREQTDDFLTPEEKKEKERLFSFVDVFWEYSMYLIALSLTIFALLVWHFSLSTVLSNERISSVLDTPCFFTLLLLGVIFLSLGFSVREMRMEKEMESEHEKEKEKLPGPQFQHDISLESLSFENERERRIFEKFLYISSEGGKKNERTKN